LKLAPSAAQFKKEKDPPYSQLQKKHHTDTEVMAKKSKSKTKLYKKRRSTACPILTICNNTIHKIQCVVKNTIKYNTVNIHIQYRSNLL
jgi:hypothetical protein